MRIGAGDGGDYYLYSHDSDASLGGEAEQFLPRVARFGGLAVHESDGILAIFEDPDGRQWSGMMWLKVSSTFCLDSLPVRWRNFIERWNRRRVTSEEDPIPF
ncbi:hypothetical protein [Frigoriglobus tundricola]|uniref:hypothetical protein n=1 Tax=Frigoriglobus tundricola TaxID=2774151 RepID=UPI00148EEB0E|nr:hypothetical protein [Frigoriglobus tundricola]